MHRGIFDNLPEEPAYKDAPKRWIIELLQCDIFWYELITNQPKEFDYKGYVSSRMNALKENLRKTVDKRFIYFIASRKKIRIIRAKYTLFGNSIYMKLRIGRNKTKSIRIPLPRGLARGDRPILTTTDTLMTWTFESGQIVSSPIHDFLRNNHVDIGVNTEIHYAGFTENPAKRPIDRKHRGLSDVLHNVSNEEFDFFIIYNLFNVHSYAENNTYGINFSLPNSLIDEVRVDEEGKILEGIFIKYFNTAAQELDKRNEIRQLENRLRTLLYKHKILSVSVNMEIDDESEYYNFFSRAVSPRRRNLFRCYLNEGNAVIDELDNIQQLLDLEKTSS